MLNPRLLDLTGVNPATGKPWGLPRELFMPNWGLRLFIHWDNHQYMEDGTPDGVVLHWSAAQPNKVHSSYPLNFVANEKGEAFVVRTLKWHQKPAHLWGRNGQFSGQVLAGNPEVSAWRPWTSQVDLAAIVGAETCAWKRIDPRAKILVPELTCDTNATKQWATGRQIHVPTIWDHANFAKVDDYGRFRYDAQAKARLPGGKLDNQMMFDRWAKRLLAHYDALKAGKAEWQFKELFA